MMAEHLARFTSTVATCAAQNMGGPHSLSRSVCQEFHAFVEDLHAEMSAQEERPCSLPPLLSVGDPSGGMQRPCPCWPSPSSLHRRLPPPGLGRHRVSECSPASALAPRPRYLGRSHSASPPWCGPLRRLPATARAGGARGKGQQGTAALLLKSSGLDVCTRGRLYAESL